MLNRKQETVREKESDCRGSICPKCGSAARECEINISENDVGVRQYERTEKEIRLKMWE